MPRKVMRASLVFKISLQIFSWSIRRQQKSALGSPSLELSIYELVQTERSCQMQADIFDNDVSVTGYLPQVVLTRRLRLMKVAIVLIFSWFSKKAAQRRTDANMKGSYSLDSLCIVRRQDERRVSGTNWLSAHDCCHVPSFLNVELVGSDCSLSLLTR